VQLFLIFIGCYLCALLVTPVLISVLNRNRVYDHPGPRKVQSRPTPTAGGIGVAAVFFLFLWTLWWIDFLDIRRLTGPLAGLSAGGLILIGIGLWDDLRGSRPAVKLSFQVLAACILFYSGFRITILTNPFSDFIELRHLELPITILWFVLVINAVNLIDGLDGLAGGVVFISAYTMFLIQIAVGEAAVMSVLLINLILAGTLLGFLRYNFFPARVFLGDTGSMFLGMAIAGSAILQSTKGAATITLMVPLITLLVPLCDTGMAFFRRVSNRKNPFLPDQQHVHHRLMGLGLSPKQVVLLIYLLCIYLAVAAIVTMGLPKQIVLVFTLIMGLGFFLAFEVIGLFQRKRSNGEDR
jgi:UDP-GlcNAc:undecaprenyl-phosphate GlcNAc-1-phosphate transferase